VLLRNGGRADKGQTKERDMELPREACMMRIFTQERARGKFRALFEDVVLKARDEGLAGATVLRGLMGFGSSSRIHNANILDLSSNLPLVIEIVDTEDKLRAFLRSIEDMKDIGLVTMEKVEVLHYG
jgi:PII-like signaling protein